MRIVRQLTNAILAPIRHPLYALRGCRRIAALPYPADLRLRLVRSYLGFRTGWTNRRRPQVDIAGFRVGFLSFDSLVYLFDQLFIEREYHFVTPSQRPVIVDCGSNIGLSVLFFKAIYPEAFIVAFEPDPRTFNCLRDNVERNELERIELHNVALSGQDGEISFYNDDDHPGLLTMSTTPGRMRTSTIRVPAFRLSRYIKGEVDFLKVDIEGAEMEVLRELAAEGKLSLVKQMVIEFHHHIECDTDRFSELLALLEKTGFGYQLSGDMRRPFSGRVFQDVLVYAYRKDPADVVGVRT